MNFIPDSFADGITGNTPITATKLNNLETGVVNDDGTNPASAEAVHDAATFVPYWAPNTFYAAGKQVVSPSGDVVTAITGFTSSTSYNPANWSLSATFVAKGSLYINAMDYGAKGDGTSDDTAAIQAALNALPANGTLFFPAGNYLCASSLTVASYVSFVGIGKASRITYSGTGTLITLTGQREVKWDRLYFVATGVGSTLFSLSNTFRCEWRSCYLAGQFVGPANSGSYLGQTGIVLTANSGDNDFVNGDITNFGIGIKTDAIQNGVTGGKLGTNNVSIYGFGGGGMAITGYTDFVSTPANTDSHIKIDGATGQWWLANIWIEGCTKAIQVGSNSGTPAGPSQFSLVNSKIAATTTALDLQCARNPTIFGLQIAGDSGNTANPTPVALDATNCPEGVMFVDSIATTAVTTASFPIGWMIHTRGGSTANLKAPNNLDLSYGGAFRMARSDNTFIPLIQMSGGPSALFRSGSSSSISEAWKFQDNAGAPVFYFDTVTSAIDYLAVAPAAAGGTPSLAARGTDTNIGLKLTPKGTGTIQAGGPVQLKATTTAARPTAASAGVGGAMYDSTLSKPIYSDGTTWRDATGAAV